MIRSSKKAGRLRKGCIALALVLVVAGVCGCQTLSFYTQALKGQYQLFAHQQAIPKLLADPQTPLPLKKRFELLEALREFAAKDLKLPVDGHYRKYVDVHRPFVVWNVEAAPEFSLEPKAWWYPLVGSLEYRGYFSEAGARKYARVLKRKGYDVYVGGVEAYSTLGWFKDPVLNTFLFEPDSGLAELIFHELGHQRLFARGDTDFNEAFATTVGQEGAKRWLRGRGDPAAYDRYLAEIRRNDQFVRLIMSTRERLAGVFGDERTEEGKIKAANKQRALPAERLRQEKERILADLRQRYAELKVEWGGNAQYDDWFAQPVNNAQLNSVAAYYDLVPGFEHLLDLNGGDLGKFYAAATKLSKKPKKERQQWLRTLGVEGGSEAASGGNAR